MKPHQIAGRFYCPRARGRQRDYWFPAGANYAFDAVRGRFVVDGKPTAQANALSFTRSTAAQKSDGTIAAINVMRAEAAGVLYEPAGDNLIQTTTFAGATVGIIGSGGVLPGTWNFSQTLIREVVSKSTKSIRMRMQRTGGSPSATSVTFRSSAFNGFPVVTGPLAYSAKVTLVSFSGAFTNLSFGVQELNTSDVFVGLTTSSLTTAGQVSEEMKTRTPVNGNKVAFVVIANLSNATADFECVFDLEMPQIEYQSSAIATSWMNSTDVTDPRGVDALTMKLLPNGAQFIGSFYENGGYWDNPTVAGNQHILTARGSRAARLTDVVSLPATADFMDRARVAEKVAKPNFIDPGTNNIVIAGNTWGQHKPTGSNWALTRASNKQNRTRFETRPSQHWSGDTLLDRHRSEFTGAPVAFDTDLWYSDWFKLVQVDWAAVSGWMISTQIHATPDGGDFGASPILAFEFTANGMSVVTRTAATGPSSNPSSTLRYFMPNFQLGRWYRRIFRTKFNNAGAGQLQIWIDGSEKINLPAISNCYPDAVGPYLKWGIYSGNAMPVGSKPTIVEYANVEWGTASLASRVATPLELV